MDIEIIGDTRNELLSRRELSIIVKYDGPTPSRLQIIGKICGLLNVSEEQIVLDSLEQTFGKMEFRANVRIYDDQKSREKTERPYIISRGKPKPKEEA